MKRVKTNTNKTKQKANKRKIKKNIIEKNEKQFAYNEIQSVKFNAKSLQQQSKTKNVLNI